MWVVSVPMWAIMTASQAGYAMRVASIIWNFCCGVRNVRCFRPHVGLPNRSAVRHAMCVASVPTRADTAPVRRLAHLCSMLGWSKRAACSPNAREERRRARPGCGGERRLRHVALDRALFQKASTTAGKKKKGVSHSCGSPSIVHDAQSDEISP